VALIDLGELSKPVTVLVEKLADAVEGFCDPYQKVRKARAEAKAERIRAIARIEIADLYRRAAQEFSKDTTPGQMEYIAAVIHDRDSAADDSKLD
jgi:hypothetical protein